MNAACSISCTSDNNDFSKNTKDDLIVAQDCSRNEKHNDESSLNIEFKKTLIDKISKVLDLSSCRTSAYSSAGECSNCTSLLPTNTNEIHFSGTYACDNKSLDTHNKSASLLILSDDEEDLSYSYTKESRKSENEDVIIISDDDDDDLVFEEQIPVKNDIEKSARSIRMSLLGKPSISKQLNQHYSRNNSVIQINDQQELIETKLNFSEISQHSTDEQANCLSHDDEQPEKFYNIDLTTDTSYDGILYLKTGLSKISQHEDMSENQKKNNSDFKSNFIGVTSQEQDDYVLPVSKESDGSYANNPLCDWKENIKQNSPEALYYEEENQASNNSSINEQSHGIHNLILNESRKLNVEAVQQSPSRLCNQNEDFLNLCDISKHSENEMEDFSLSTCKKTVKSCDNSFVSHNIPSSSPARKEVYDNYNRNSVTNTSHNQDATDDEETNDMNASGNSKFDWNDTIEEMERFVQIDDYELSNENTHDTNTSSNVEKLDNPNTSDSKLYLDTTTSKPKKSLIPIKNSNQFLNPHKDVYTNFKIPTRIVSVKPNYKTVLSPVSVYIKNSPQAPLLQRVPSKPLSAKSLFPKATSNKIANKENKFDLPTLIYKPAKHTVISEKEQLKLPGNIQKHISHIPNIIKHQGRTGGEKLGQNVENKLLEENLTICDDSRFSTSSVEDVSLLVSKKAYIK